MPRKTTGKAGRINQSRDLFVIKVNREDVKFEISVLYKSPSHLLLQKSGWEGQNGKRKQGGITIVLLFALEKKYSLTKYIKLKFNNFCLSSKQSCFDKNYFCKNMSLNFG